MKVKSTLHSLLVSSLLFSSLALAHEKIVGGVPVTDIRETPYMVSLSGVCGGSIISSSWVLTAAHCAGHFSNVKGGVLNLRDQGATFTIKRVIKHPRFNQMTLSNDFALVELNEKINFQATGLRPVRLATKRFENDGGQNPGIDSIVYGFGNTGSGQQNWNKNLNKVVLPIVSSEVANRPESYNGEVDETMLAAGYAGGGKDSCQGDSGGPMVVFDHRNDPVQVGVVSWGEGCATPNKYGIYSKISGAQAWIQEVTGL